MRRLRQRGESSRCSTTIGKKIERLGRLTASVRRVFQHMQRNPIVSIPAVAKTIGISAPTVAKSMEYMRGLGKLREVTGLERRRMFGYEPYLAILNEGTEPIQSLGTT